MSVLVYIENWDGALKKSTFEAVSYAKEVANNAGSELIAVSLGNVSDDELNKLGTYGVSKLIKLEGDDFANFNSDKFATSFAQIAQANGAKQIIINGTMNGKSMSPGLAVKLNASVISEVVEVPSLFAPLTVKKKAFSGKAFANIESKTDATILILSPNAFGLKENTSTVAIESGSADAGSSNLNHVKFEKSSGKVSITEAEVVISGGRGLKGPENWTMVEELAELLGAGTACSKPVSDIGWRPHHEHVGQTGIAVAPNLYIAIGISGAIQHLAGVNSSKVMVAINIDPEAPFFKAADYGIVGDAFDVVPKLIEEIKKFKAN
jgi:electron transfer flavoprotein alpha subunit